MEVAPHSQASGRLHVRWNSHGTALVLRGVMPEG